MQVQLQTNDRIHWIRAEDGGGREGEMVHGRPKGLATAAGSDASAWQTFEMRRAPDGRVGFRSPDGGWLSAQQDGTLVFNRERPDEWIPEAWESFRVEPGIDGGISLVTDHGTRVRAVNQGGGELRHDQRDSAGIDETFFPSSSLTGGGGHVGGGGVPVDVQPVTQVLRRLGNRFFTADGHTPFDYREISAFALYRRWLNGENLDAYCAYLRGFKVNVVRVILTLSGGWWEARGTNCGPSIPGFYERLTEFTSYLAQQGLYVRYCLIGGLEEFGVNPPNRGSHYTRDCHHRIMEFVRRVVGSLASAPNVVWEVMNEFNQIGASNAEGEIVEIARLIKSMAPHLVNLSNMNGPTADDPDFVRSPADFVDSHLERRRGIAGFEWVKRSSESPVVDQDDMPFLSGEPINFGSPAPGKRDGDDNEPSTAVAFAYGATSRCKKYYCNFHYEGGLDAVLPDAVTEACLGAWTRGLDAIPTGFNGGWCNGHHGCAPFRSDIYPSHSDNEDRWRGPIRIFGLSGGDGYIGVSIREPAHGYEPPLKSGRNVREIARETYGDWCSVVRAE
jgi:hypothetical protein